MLAGGVVTNKDLVLIWYYAGTSILLAALENIFPGHVSEKAEKLKGQFTHGTK